MAQFLYDDLSWKPQIDKSEGTFYLAIVTALENDIRNSILKPGDKLPPQRELADFLQVNLTTVTKAFKICVQRGLIYATVGRGTYISSDAAILKSGPEADCENKLIELGTLRPLYEQNNLIAESISEMVHKVSISKYFEYDEPKIKAAHCEAGSLWLKRFRRHAEPGDIVIASGAQNALAITLLSLFQPGDKIAVDSLTYTGFKNLACLFGVRLVPIEMNEDGLASEQLQKACTTDKMKGLYLMPECHNPTTYTMPLSHRQKIAALVKEYSLILIEDDTYSFLGNTEFPPVSEFVPEQSIYICSTSKSLSAGLRVAFMAVAAKFRDQINHGIHSINLNTSHFNVEIVADLIENGLADRILDEKRLEAEARNKIFDDIMNEYIVKGNRRDYFRWLTLPVGWTGKEFELYAKMSGVQVYCAERFAVGSDLVPPAVRIATSSTRDRKELVSGLTILRDLLQKKIDTVPFIV